VIDRDGGLASTSALQIAAASYTALLPGVTLSPNTCLEMIYTGIASEKKN
jgi:hypothetical protein